MSNAIQTYIRKRIQERKEENNFRSLKISNLIDFCSNDYLGFARDAVLHQRIEQEIKQYPGSYIGSTGSRLLSGNNTYAEALETQLASFHQAGSALLFNSGFDANYGLLSALPYKGDTVIYDELVHASIHDGIRHSKANAVSFLHNNVLALENALQSATGLKYVVVESVYSMDGDFAPLEQIAALCEKYEAGLIVDEAHATGVFGIKGEGRVQQLELQDKCLARMHTFGKALGVHGAVILGSSELKDFLINYCRPFIFSTALPFHTLVAVKCAYDYLPEVNERRGRLADIIGLFRNNLAVSDKYQLLPSDSPIQSIVITGNADVKSFAAKLQQAGFDARPILYPTVARGMERVRICLHSFNTDEEIKALTKAIATL